MRYNGGIPDRARLRNTFQTAEIYSNKSEARGVVRGPLVIVHEAPDDVVLDISACVNRFFHCYEVPAEVIDPVVIGTESLVSWFAVDRSAVLGYVDRDVADVAAPQRKSCGKSYWIIN